MKRPSSAISFGTTPAATCAHNNYTRVEVLDRGCGRTPGDKEADDGNAQPDVLVLPWRSLRGWPRSHRGRGSYLPLAGMLSTSFTTDAHFTQYYAPTHPFRLLSNAHEALTTPPRMMLMVVDVDSPEAHAARIPATDAWFNDEHAKLAGLLEDMPGGFVYRTTGGYRIVYRLPQPFLIDSRDAELAWRLFYVRSLVHLGREFGVVGDGSCKPWAWLFRTPRATRNQNKGPEAPYTMGDPTNVGRWTYVPR